MNLDLHTFYLNTLFIEETLSKFLTKYCAFYPVKMFVPVYHYVLKVVLNKKTYWLVSVEKIKLFCEFITRDIFKYVTTPTTQQNLLHFTCLDFRQCPKCVVVVPLSLCNQACNTAHLIYSNRQMFRFAIFNLTFFIYHTF